jgi:hypothetical protein
MTKNGQEYDPGGGGGIRTHVTVSRKHAFQACALSHSATPPYRPISIPPNLHTAQPPYRLGTGACQRRQAAPKPRLPNQCTKPRIEAGNAPRPGQFPAERRDRTGTVGGNIVITIGLTRHRCRIVRRSRQPAHSKAQGERTHSGPLPTPTPRITFKPHGRVQRRLSRAPRSG